MAEDKEESFFKDVVAQVDSNELELGVLAHWEKENIFEKSLEQNKDNPLFTFYDGPPYATGKPHYGHVLQSAIKDTVLRYQTMRGRYVPRRVGWDTHGLPIENIVEKELGFTTKREIEDDIERFNAKCREVVYRYVDEFSSVLKRLGRWADYDNAYSTLDRGYMETEWWVFRKLWDMDLVYKAYRSTPYCIRCATPLSNFEVSMAYKDTYDKTVYVKLVVRGANQKLSLLVWTTTPWTLPANVAVAIHPDIEYVVAELDGEQMVIAKKRVEAVLGSEAVVVRDISSEELLGFTYEPLFTSPLTDKDEISRAFRVVEGGHVTAQDGTGLVHMAPAFGEEDHIVAKEQGVPIPRIVDGLGNYVEDAPHFAGENIFETNSKIITYLKEAGALFKQEMYKHSYPFCWRCDTPLIYYALDSWFVKVADLKEQMLKTNEDIHWIPEHVKKGRFAKGIESAPDWAVSRNRFWSVPMPIWECDACDARVCVGSVEELRELSGASEDAVADLHRPYVDDITWKCSACPGQMKRISEVLDVWFDSGSMPYAQWHYPFENKEFVESGFPADFIAESIEMTRAWFYVLHVLSSALTSKEVGLGERKPAFNNVIASGIIFAEDGQKLSKKLKNYPEIGPVLEKYGADVLRFYLLTSSSLGEPYRFSEKDMRGVQRNVYMTLWNVYSFFVRYARAVDWKMDFAHGQSSHILDRWILARVATLEKDVCELTDSYHIDRAGREFVGFIDDLSNWYVRRSRARFHVANPDMDAFATLYEVLVRVSRLLAPFMPFVAEEMYRNLTGEESVHLATLTLPEESGDDALLEEMATARRVVTEGLALRSEVKIKVRQPLSVLSVNTDMSKELRVMVAEEVNVKEVVSVADLPVGDEWVCNEETEKVRVALNTEISPELLAEGVGREVIRQGQSLRRQAGYELDDRIVLVFVAEDEGLKNIVESQREHIMKVLQADAIELNGEQDAQAQVKLNGVMAHIGVRKV